MQKVMKVVGSSGSNDNDDYGGSGDNDDDDGDGDGDGDGECAYLVPIVFYNLSYDGHFVLQFFSQGVHRVYDEDGNKGVRQRGHHST